MKLLYAWMNCPELLEIVTKHCLPLMPEQFSHGVNVIVLLSIDVLGYNQACMLSFRCSIPAWQLNICTICVSCLQAGACHCSFSTAVTTCPVVPALFASLSTITILFYTQFAFAMAFSCFSLWHCDLILALKRECWGFQPVCNWTVWLAITCISFPKICHLYLITNNW